VIYPHWKKRVLTFAFPDRDPLGAGWNKRQSEIAVGSGGLWGKGYLNGTQNVLGFLPRSVSSTDFIFSVIAEETGFVGSLVLLGLYLGVFGAVATTGFLCRDSVGRLVCAGVGTLLFVHVFVNIAMTVGRVPITGLPLPLISYGGSFTISTMAMLGLVQSVAVHGQRPDRSH
jgi:rod shape determining protein RodA